MNRWWRWIQLIKALQLSLIICLLGKGMFCLVNKAENGFNSMALMLISRDYLGYRGSYCSATPRTSPLTRAVPLLVQF